MQFAAGERKVRFHLLMLDVGAGRAICDCATSRALSRSISYLALCCFP